jgi:hypothetical protein
MAEKSIDFAEVDLGFGAGSCPAPNDWLLPVANIHLRWNYDAACTVAPLVKAGLLALTLVGCLVYIGKGVNT